MQFGIYAPVPHVTVGSPEILHSIDSAMSPLAPGEIDDGFEHARLILTEADRAGFDTILYAERHLGADLEAWVLACAVAPFIKRARSMVAVHPGLWHPQLIAKMASSLDRIAQGRMAINLVTGWNIEEHSMFGGDALVGDNDRYIRAEEFVEILRGMWRERRYSFKGAFYNVDGAELRLKPATSLPPEIFTASRSERGLDMVAKTADWWFVDFDKRAQNPDDYMNGVRSSIESMRRRAEKYGRTVRFALNPFIGFGDTDQDALARAKALLAPASGDDDTRKLEQRIGPAMFSGCIGRPETVRARLEAFADAGVEFFLFKFAPRVEIVREIETEAIAPLRGRSGR